ncbi:MAG: carboxypeptidase-like regulatory domain-containing protein [Acidobacteriia bacterium]|nr:carboxypeptidase-like regulatory domain-containing protein [Terriglobia bacterium]
MCLLSLPLAGQEGTATLSGKMQNILGVGISGGLAELRAERPAGRLFQARSDDSGSFHFSGLPGDGYTLKLQSGGFVSLTIRSIQIGDREQKSLPSTELAVSGFCGEHAVIDYLRLLAVGGFNGSIRRDQGPKNAGGAPVANADVTLICRGGVACRSTKTNSVGEFQFEGLSAGGYTVRVTHQGFYPLDEPGYAVQGGFDSFYWPIRLERCRLGDCDPSRRPKKPPALCE